MKRFLVEERLLDSMQVPAFFQSLNGGYLLSDDGSYRSAARPDRAAIEQHCACATLSFTAAILGARKIEFVAQN